MNRRRYWNTSNSVLIALAAIGLSIFAALALGPTVLLQHLPRPRPTSPRPPSCRCCT